MRAVPALCALCTNAPWGSGLCTNGRDTNFDWEHTLCVLGKCSVALYLDVNVPLVCCARHSLLGGIFVTRCGFWPNCPFLHSSQKSVNLPILHKFDQQWLQLRTFFQRSLLGNSAATMLAFHYGDPETAGVM